jgi:hypothetical protein
LTNHCFEAAPPIRASLWRGSIWNYGWGWCRCAPHREQSFGSQSAAFQVDLRTPVFPFCFDCKCSFTAVPRRMVAPFLRNEDPLVRRMILIMYCVFIHAHDTSPKISPYQTSPKQCALLVPRAQSQGGSQVHPERVGTVPDRQPRSHQSALTRLRKILNVFISSFHTRHLATARKFLSNVPHPRPRKALGRTTRDRMSGANSCATEVCSPATMLGR